MAYYAFIDENNVVVEVIVGRDEDEIVNGITDWEKYYSDKRPGLRALRTSYNTYGGVHYTPRSNERTELSPSADQSKALRYNYASTGFIYDEARDAFIPPKPFDSWVLDEATYSWVAPVPYPEDGKAYTWDEALGDWVEVIED